MTARTLLAEADRNDVLARLGRLQAGPPRWGRMSTDQMLCHVAEALRMALGELSLPSSNKPLFRTRVVKYLIFSVFPFPKSAPTAPGLVATATLGFDAERARVVALVGRFAGLPDSGPGPEHPLFGPLSWPEWGQSQHKHLDHHLRQFGA
jgi:hypothetical protein